MPTDRSVKEANASAEGGSHPLVVDPAGGSVLVDTDGSVWIEVVVPQPVAKKSTPPPAQASMTHAAARRGTPSPLPAFLRLPRPTSTPSLRDPRSLVRMKHRVARGEAP